MPNVRDIYMLLDKIFPYNLAEKWDNSGLVCGNPNSKVTSVLVSLDITLDVINEAKELGCNLIISHHPLIYDGIKSVTTDDLTGKKLTTLIQNDIAAISCHTNLDIAENGVNDTLAKKCGLQNVSVFLDVGTNQFLGRIGEVEKTNIADFALKVKVILGCAGLRYCDGGKAVQKVAVIGGAGGSFYQEAIKAGADTFVSGDCKYSNFLPSYELGFNLIDAGHFQTENVINEILKEVLLSHFPNLKIIASQNKDIIKYI